ncbi:hypothetical protein SO802_016982 [Lithocarpus litseifolius]|uniref:Uncharacterized protein n=1 Tax=Lithocarpus litseifolius TaxID=425828 RepID=A0AAW2D3E7_9ROSI
MGRKTDKFLHHQAELFDSKVVTNLLDIILTKMEKVFLTLPKVFFIYRDNEG